MKFTDLHDKMAQCVNGLISKESFYSWLDENIKVKSYLSIATKYAIISMFSDRLNQDISDYLEKKEATGYIYMMYDINIMFELLFKYIEVIVLSKNRTIENYDLVMQSGLYDYIVDKCGSDYKNLVEKCDRASNIETMGIIRELSNIFVNPPSVEDMEKIKDIINNDIDKKKLQILKAVEEYNNPTLKKILDKASKITETQEPPKNG